MGLQDLYAGPQLAPAACTVPSAHPAWLRSSLHSHATAKLTTLIGSRDAYRESMHSGSDTGQRMRMQTQIVTCW